MFPLKSHAFHSYSTHKQNCFRAMQKMSCRSIQHMLDVLNKMTLYRWAFSRLYRVYAFFYSVYNITCNRLITYQILLSYISTSTEITFPFETALQTELNTESLFNLTVYVVRMQHGCKHKRGQNFICAVAICKIHDVHKYLGIKSLIVFLNFFSLLPSFQLTFYGKSSPHSLDTFYTLIANEFR